MNRIVPTCLLVVIWTLFAGPVHAADQSDIQFELTPELFGSESYQPGPFVVHLHCGDGTATAKLLTQSSTVAQGLDLDPKNIAIAKANQSSQPNYGSRLTFRTFDGKHLPFINNTVNVIVSAAELAASPAEIHRVLAPGGVAIFRSRTKPTIDESLASVTSIDRGRYRGFYRLGKKWPTDIDEWTHHMHGPDNNRVARDTRLAPPLSHLQWSVGPRYTRHHEYMSSFQAMVSAHGRIFYIIDEGKHDSILLPPDWKLIARDAFNGIVLWKRPLDNWFNHLWPFKSGPLTLPRRLVVQGDRVFVTLGIGSPISVLDATSGKVLHSLEGTEGTEEIIIDGNRLFAVKRDWLTEANKHEVKERIRNGASTGEVTRRFGGAISRNQTVMAFDLTTRKMLWEHATRVAPLGIGARDGTVYIFDGQAVTRRNAADGREIWRSDPLLKKPQYYAVNYACNLVCDDQKILVGSAAGESMLALSAKDGSVLWSKPQYRSGRHAARDLFLIDDKAWTTNTLVANMALPDVPGTGNPRSSRVTGYDLNSGDVASDFLPKNDVYSMNARCHMSAATENFLITSRTGTELVSLTDKEWHIHHWMRGACLYGLMPANGIIYAPPNPCACYTQSKLNGFNAVTGFDEQWASTVESHGGQTLVRGTANGTPARNPIEQDAWPVYRHDNARSGSTASKVALPLQTGWRTEGFDELTGLVVAGGLCVFAEKKRHTVHALDAQTGSRKWAFVAAGRIDSPPTIAGPSLLFGSADGWLYHLRTSDGELVWKRRIAQADLSLFVRSQPESVWPLSGSVLVQDGKVYCVAGRSAFLDGGLRLAVVDAATGELLFDNRMDDRDPHDGENMQQHIALQNMPVALPDLLSGDGENLYMLTQQFDLEGKRTHIKNAAFEKGVKMGIDREHIFSATGFLDDNSFHRTYWVYGNSFLEGCSMPNAGWFEMGRISPSGKMLCFDDKNVYGYGQFPEYAKWSGPLRYSLFSVNKAPKSYTPGMSDEELSKIKPDWRKWRSARLPKVEFGFEWRFRPSVRAKAIIKTADTLFVAGPEDLIDEEIVYGNTRSRLNRELLKRQNQALLSEKGGKLLAISVTNGGIVQTIDLESGPVWDGMAAAYDKLFIACKDGSVVALANDGTKNAEGTYNPDALKQPKVMLPVSSVGSLSPRSASAVTRRGSPRQPTIHVTKRPTPTSTATLTKIGGRIVTASSFQPGREVDYIIDGNPATFWHTRFAGGDAKPPHYVILQVPTGTQITGMSYTAWSGGNGNGHVKAFAVSVSPDGKNWSDPIESGDLKIGHAGVQSIAFPGPCTEPFIKFQVTASRSSGNRFLAAIGELDVVVDSR